MDFSVIFSNMTASGPVGAIAGAAALMALACFAEFVGKTLARYWTGRLMRGRL